MLLLTFMLVIMSAIIIILILFLLILLKTLQACKCKESHVYEVGSPWPALPGEGMIGGTRYPPSHESISSFQNMNIASAENEDASSATRSTIVSSFRDDISLNLPYRHPYTVLEILDIFSHLPQVQPRIFDLQDSMQVLESNSDYSMDVEAENLSSNRSSSPASPKEMAIFDSNEIMRRKNVTETTENFKSEKYNKTQQDLAEEENSTGLFLKRYPSGKPPRFPGSTEKKKLIFLKGDHFNKRMCSLPLRKGLSAQDFGAEKIAFPESFFGKSEFSGDFFFQKENFRSFPRVKEYSDSITANLSPRWLQVNSYVWKFKPLHRSL